MPLANQVVRERRRSATRIAPTTTRPAATTAATSPPDALAPPDALLLPDEVDEALAGDDDAATLGAPVDERTAGGELLEDGLNSRAKRS